MRFFLPDWEDRVHKNYDFLQDKPIENYTDSKYSYIWDIYGKKNIPIDGLLISRANLLTPKMKLNTRGVAFQEQGIRKYYNFPDNFPLMCDCGAFSYIMDDIPPFDPIETLDFYANCDFNFGVSIDHLIVSATLNQKEKRYKITRDNAKIMFDEWVSNKKYRQKLKLIGVIQGWDIKSYCRMTNELLEIGYDYIAIGGVARSSNKEIIPIVTEVRKTIDNFTEKNNIKNIDIHVFGVGRANLFRTYFENRITSFDSASFLRSAWLSDYRGYHQGFDYYTPIRVKIKKTLQKELKILKQLRNYTSRNSLSKIINILEKEDEYTESIKRKSSYQKTLESYCWEQCECEICKDIGIDIVIFRGNNRNRRRGFHNVWNYYYQKLLEYLPKISLILVIKKFKKGLAYHSLDKKIQNQIINLPIEIFVTDNRKILHISEDTLQSFDTKLRSQINRSEWIFSNSLRCFDEKEVLLVDKNKIKTEVEKKLSHVYKKLIKPQNLLKLEGNKDIQEILTSFSHTKI